MSRTEHQPPIVLIGAARSGTKFLRDLLGQADGVATVPFDVNYIWRSPAPGHPHDALPEELADTRAGAVIPKTLRQTAKAGPNDVLLEKTVSNTLRVPYVDAVMPDARFVHLVRDGRDVTESAMRLWQVKPDWRALGAKLRRMPVRNVGYAVWFARNLVGGLGRGRGGGKVWGPRFPGISDAVESLPLAEVCAIQWRTSVTTARCDLAGLPKSRTYQIRYEDLVANDTALSNLVNWLDLPADRILSAWARDVRPAPASLFEALPAHERDGILKQIAPTLTDLGYPT